MQPQTLLDLLSSAATTHGESGLFIYPPGNVETLRYVGYPELLRKARRNTLLLIRKESLQPGPIVLIHLKNHLDGIEWFWSVLLAGCIPATSTPFSNDINQRRKHIFQINTLLQSSLCLTWEDYITEFAGQDVRNICTVESFVSRRCTLS